MLSTPSEEKKKQRTAGQSNLNIYASYSFENQLKTKSERSQGQGCHVHSCSDELGYFWSVAADKKNLGRGFSQSRPILNADCIISIYNEVLFFLNWNLMFLSKSNQSIPGLISTQHPCRHTNDVASRPVTTCLSHPISGDEWWWVNGVKTQLN